MGQVFLKTLFWYIYLVALVELSNNCHIPWILLYNCHIIIDRTGKGQFHSNPKERQCQKCSNYHTIALISHTSKVMLKILQARLQQYVNHELPDVQARFSKGRGTRDQIANIQWMLASSKKQESSRKTSYFCFIDYAKAFDCVDHNNLWKILKDMGIPDQLTCLLRNLYAG